MKRLSLILFALALLLFAVGCEDTTTTYTPTPNVWTTVMTNLDFGFGKIWDGAGTGRLRICGFNGVPQGNVMYYVPSSNDGGQGDPVYAGAQITDVSGLNRYAIWCSAKDSSAGRVYFYNGAGWLRNYCDEIFGGGVSSLTYKLYGVCVFEEGGIEHRIFVGEDGYILHYVEGSTGGGLGGVEGDQWHETTTSGGDDLYSVWGSDTAHLWAVGEDGVIYTYAGNYTWTTVTSPTSYDLHDIHGTTQGSAVYWYAVGENGTVLYYDSTNVTQLTGLPTTSSTLEAVFMLNANRAITVGTNGYVLQTTTGSTGFSQTTGVTNKDCYGCFISSDGKNTYVATSDAVYDGTLIRLYQP